MSNQGSNIQELTPGQKLSAYMVAMDNGNRAYREGDFEVAAPAFAEAAALRPEMFQPHLMLGMTLRAKDDILGALTAFQGALDLQPKNSDLLCQIGELLYSKQLYREALTVFSEAVMSDDRYSFAICGMADVLATMGEYDVALELLKPAIEREPLRPELWTSLGIVCHKGGNLESAAIFYEEAIRLQPGVEPATENLALIRSAKN